MNNHLIVDIKNLGSIKELKINLKKINIIVGINGSGKSTASKLLYCFLTASSKNSYLLVNKNISEYFTNFVFYWHNKLESSNLDTNKVNKLLLLTNNFNLDKEVFDNEMEKKFTLLKEIMESMDFSDKENFFEELKDIEKLVKFNKNFNTHFFNIFNDLLDSELNIQDFIKDKKPNIFIHGNIGNYKLEYDLFSTNSTVKKCNYIDRLNFEDIIYMDSSSIFDISTLMANNSINEIPYHIVQLSNLLKIKNGFNTYENENNQKIKDFKNKFNNLLKGSFYFDSQINQFKFKQDNSMYINSTASGFKQISIIQLLLENKKLNKNSFLFIDGIEVNLHPEWQVKLAEIVILLVKELNIHVYINSHSPQFIEALEVYSAKYGLVDDSSFYLSEKTENDKYIFREIKRDHLFELYNNLGNPYDIVDEIRAENLSNNIY